MVACTIPGSIKDYVLNTQTRLGVIQAVLFTLYGTILFSYSCSNFAAQQKDFVCEKISSTVQKQQCMDQYNSGENFLQANLLIPSIYFLFPIALWILAGVLIVTSTGHLKWREDDDGNVKCHLHIRDIYLIQLVSRCFFFFGMVVLYSLKKHNVLLKSVFQCKIFNHSRGNSTEIQKFTCADASWKSKQYLNIFYFAGNCLFLVLATWELIVLCCDLRPKWSRIPSAEHASCKVCRYFLENCLNVKFALPDDILVESNLLHDITEKVKSRYRHGLSEVTQHEFQGQDKDEMFGFRSAKFTDVMVEVCMVESATCKEEISQNVERTQYFDMTERMKSSRIDLGDIMVPESKLTTIRGIAGIGKTWLLNFLALKWTCNEIFTNRDDMSFDLVFFFKFRELNSYKEDKDVNIETLLKNDFGIDFQELQRVFHNDEERILFIFDGLDEFFDFHRLFAHETAKEGIHSLIYNIVKRNSPILPGHYTLISGRPHAMKYLERHQSVTGTIRMIDIIGFTDNMIEAYISKIEDAEICQRVRDRMDSSMLLKAFCSVPLFLRNILDITRLELRNDKQLNFEISSLTDIYSCTFASLLRGHCIDAEQDFTSWDLDDIFRNDLVRRFLNNIGKICYHLVKEKKIIFDGSSFNELNPTDVQSHLIKAFVVKTGDSKCQFVHLSFQEFLAAYYCFHNSVSVRDLLNEELYEVVEFYAGFVNASRNTTKIKSWLLGFTAEIDSSELLKEVSSVCNFAENSESKELGTKIFLRVILELFEEDDKLPCPVNVKLYDFFVSSEIDVLLLRHFAALLRKNDKTDVLRNSLQDGAIDIACSLSEKSFLCLAETIPYFCALNISDQKLHLRFTNKLLSQCTKEKHNLKLRRIFLRRCKLNGRNPAPDVIGLASFLECISFFDSEFTAVDIKEMADHLESLVLDLSHTIKIKKLDLVGSSLGGKNLATDLVRLASFVNDVGLSFNEFTAVDIKDMADHLESLSVNSSHIIKIKKLDFMKCSLGGRSLATDLMRLTCFVEKVDLCVNEFTAVDMKDMADHLESLYVNSNHNIKIKTLALKECSLGGKNLATDLIRLACFVEDVDLTGNKFAAVDIKDMADHLESVYVNSSHIIKTEKLELVNCSIGGRNLATDLMRLACFVEKVYLSLNEFTAVDLKDMADHLESLARNSSRTIKIKKLTLNCCSLGGRNLATDLIRLACFVENVDLSFNSFTAVDMKDMAFHLKSLSVNLSRNIKIKKLDLRNCFLGGRNLATDLIRLACFVEDVDLSDNNFTECDMKDMANQLESLSVNSSHTIKTKKLDLGDCSLGGRNLATDLMSLAFFVEDVELTSNELTAVDIKEMADRLESLSCKSSHTIKINKLNLRNCSLGGQNLATDLMRLACFIEDFDLSVNEFTAVDMKTMADSLQSLSVNSSRNIKIKKLDLRNCSLGGENLASDLMRLACFVEDFVLTFNSFTAVDMKDMADHLDYLSVNSSHTIKIKKLNLSYCSLGGRSLATDLMRLACLIESINLEENNFAADEVEFITDWLLQRIKGDSSLSYSPINRVLCDLSNHRAELLSFQQEDMMRTLYSFVGELGIK